MPETAILHTNLGDIELEFLPDKAPNHVTTFLQRAKDGYYAGTTFHRVIPGFMVQGGDPNSRLPDRSLHGSGGPEERLHAEFNDTKHLRGVLSAARTSDPNSAGSQFFIMVADAKHLDGQYTAFGRVKEGMGVVDQIVALPKDSKDNPLVEHSAVIESVEVIDD